MASSQQSATGITPRRGLHLLVCGWIKVVIRFIFGGRWLYMMWLKRSGEAEHEAQRKRNKAPSWLFDSHKTLERKLRRRAKTIHPPPPRDVAQSGTSSDALNSHMSSSFISVETDGIEPETSTFKPIDEPRSSVHPNGSQAQLRPSFTEFNAPIDQSETYVYLGPVGEDRPIPAQVEAMPARSDHVEARGQGRVDLPLVLMIGSLMMIGLLMVYSSSIVRAGLPRGGGAGNPEYFFAQQIVFMGVGIVVMFAVSRVPYQVWGMLSLVLLLVGIIGLGLVFSPLGKNVNGANRWINIGINIQPIEFVKFIWILTLSFWFGDRRQNTNTNFTFWVPALLSVPIFALLAGQPDFGSMILIGFIFGATYLIVGGPWARLLLPALVLIPPLGYFMANKFDHILTRLTNYADMLSSGKKIEYNLHQALISFCSGRFTGVGLGQSSQKEYFLPEAHTDFILAIFGAEYGFIGVFVLVALYLGFLARSLYIARHAYDLFGSIVVTMIAVMFCVQAFINMSMAIGLLPTKGLTLPLISYGGSSLLITCVSLGLILNVSRGHVPGQVGTRYLLLAHRLNPFPWFLRWCNKSKQQRDPKRSSQTRVH